MGRWLPSRLRYQPLPTVTQQLAGQQKTTYTKYPLRGCMERSALLPVIRLLFVALGSLAATITLAQAEDSADGVALSVIAAARTGDWAQAYFRAGQSTDSLPLKIVRWLDDTRPPPTGR